MKKPCLVKNRQAVYSKQKKSDNSRLALFKTFGVTRTPN